MNFDALGQVKVEQLAALPKGVRVIQLALIALSALLAGAGFYVLDVPSERKAAVVLLSIAAVVYGVVLWLMSSHRDMHAARMTAAYTAVAQANGWQLLPELPVDSSLPPTKRLRFGVLTGQLQGRTFALYERYVNTDRGQVTDELHFCVTVPWRLPKCRLTASGTLALPGSQGTRIHLEGDFSKHIGIIAEKGQEVAVTDLFSPDVMQTVLGAWPVTAWYADGGTANNTPTLIAVYVQDNMIHLKAYIYSYTRSYQQGVVAVFTFFDAFLKQLNENETLRGGALVASPAISAQAAPKEI